MLFQRFLRDPKGSVLPMFALALVPVIGFVGAAIDYSRAANARTEMQAALDATALFVSKNAATLTAGQLQKASVDYFNAQFINKETTISGVTASYTSSGGSALTVSASGTVATHFMSVMGASFNNIPIGSSATVKWGNTMLRVALVLDNTGSMQDNGKMTALQTATKNLLAQLQAAATTNGDVYVSIVPFVKDVNVGPSNYSANWIYWGNAAQDPTQSDNNSWDANNGSCSQGNASPRSACVAQGSCTDPTKTSQSSCTASYSCSISGYYTQHSCQSANECSDPNYTNHGQCKKFGGTWLAGVWGPAVWTSATWTPANHNTWTGCVKDRGLATGPDTSGNYDTNATAPNSAVVSSLYAAEQYSACPQAVMPLSYNWSGMTTMVNNMSPNGSTNQAIGLQLGWMSLVGGGPFPTPPAMSSSYTYQQVIILLTDGLNTQNRWYGDGSSLGTSDDAKIDAREALTCANIKATGVTLYTIQVNTSGDPTSTLLQNCATDASKFFLLTTADQMVSTFNTIGTNISKLRIAN